MPAKLKDYKLPVVNCLHLAGKQSKRGSLSYEGYSDAVKGQAVFQLCRDCYFRQLGFKKER